jgi:hypothetical protein
MNRNAHRALAYLIRFLRTAPRSLTRRGLRFPYKSAALARVRVLFSGPLYKLSSYRVLSQKTWGISRLILARLYATLLALHAQTCRLHLDRRCNVITIPRSHERCVAYGDPIACLNGRYVNPVNRINYETSEETQALIVLILSSLIVRATLC